MKQENGFVSGRIKSVKFAVLGAYKLITTEHSVMVQSSLAVLMTIAGFYFKISREEWMMQILVFGLVLAIEGLNTAVEKIADFIHPDYHEKIGFIKDIAAGAVMFAAMSAIAVGTLIYLPRIL
ncbi:Diacylglycerol kinase [Flavobacterium indicum GPTSA100-9 = DSM 17447]|uniref:Diacylglycerol kinase n=1 Tax=Flavobacterium indicum (strain DSM 17447 / CIP 109464 / GPTSA100-9) TaxID=1094466 RepID=H8XTS4_FLAIG|nr:diacylglycerol kinase family protein [Flavobacterium indicum]CCG53654.1 Diacylglycerol kinase [Flavobacterium indicum GPTSA100-9 = DSM 17447]